MAKLEKILWIGPVFEEAVVAIERAVSPAANDWQKSLLNAMRRRNKQIILLSHLADPPWPKGRLIVSSREARFAQGLKGVACSYANIYLLRDRILQLLYRKKCDQLARRFNPDVAICYNLSGLHLKTCLYLQQRHSVPVVFILADLDHTPTSTARFRIADERFDGAVFLSWHLFSKSNAGSKFHLDGLIEDTFAMPGKRNGKFNVLFLGMLNQYTGIELLMDAFGRMDNPNIHLKICGKGDESILRRFPNRDGVIEYLGFVTSERLHQECLQADLFVNPRPNSILANHNNFPSKILKYLSYGKPIISTLTHGMAPRYRDVLVALDKEDPDLLKYLICDISAWDERRKNDESEKIMQFVKDHKMWDVQIDDFNAWIEQKVLA